MTDGQPFTSNLPDALREALCAVDERDRSRLEESIREVSYFGSAGLLLLRYAAAWSLSSCSEGKYANEEERRKAVSVMSDSSSPWFGFFDDGVLGALVDTLSGGAADGRRIPDDQVYVALIAVIYYGMIQAWGANDEWGGRFDRMIRAFNRHHVRD